ncbi:coagulation factor 5/8 type domain protein [Caldicellulosiruptor kronotskyensis 2002]|uniref:Coagulation factor 5/8 type domain protein n=1 Tax=Caldicellulosiruptor kronotskyensis (strain DSM 18902 / VKM B-2412 / 2002) TaxID=632348 RepID=E4SCH4_CALK2|nr:discoidin domain-containing protein [Caldicellulosiruptor kronotskyensis]ADQ45029.1 coagulation factor 5/8 type domain protein [Caldicellulosiruptor kronotskyensis 2002]
MKKFKKVIALFLCIAFIEGFFFSSPVISKAETNLALNKAVTASSTQAGLDVKSAVDGNVNTRWGSDWSDPQWISVDLGSVYSVNKVVLRWETAYGKSYKIQVSTDGMNWTDVYSTTAGDGGVDEIVFSPVNARYVRMYGTERGTGWGYSLWEFEVYGGAAVQDTTCGGNLALNKAVTASSTQAGLDVKSAVDGNVNTRWGSNWSDPQWISVDLGSVYSVNKVVLRWETAYGKSYKIQVSTDGMNWTDVYSTTTGDGGVDEIVFSPVNARYVRMYGTERGTGWGYSLWEFEVYDSEEVEKVATPVITPGTGTYTSAQTVSITCATAGATIRYTTDGTEPTPANGIVYSGPFTVTATTTIKAIAYKDGMLNSDVATAVITINSTILSAPTGLKVSSVTTTSISLEWSPVPGVSGYNIYRSFVPEGPYVKVNSSPITSTNYTDSGLDSATYYYKVSAVNASGESNLSEAVSAKTVLYFGPHVKIFDPSMSSAEIQSICDTIFAEMEKNQFGTQRYALFFKPGSYSVNLSVGFYTSVHGLGKRPDDVTITGSVRCEADWMDGNATCNFWRSVENLTVIPTYRANNLVSAGTETWAASQAAPLRRVHIKGGLSLWDPGSNYDKSWSSGGFIADSVIDGQITSGSQQQYFTRNTQMGSWSGSNWNMVFVGDIGAPAEQWPNPAYTVVNQAPVIREKPFIYIDDSGNYAVFVPAVRTNAQGISWANGMGEGTSLSMDQFVVAHPETSTAATLNQALSQGKNILFTPGIYHLSEPLRVSKPNTVILGLGLATLVPDNGTPAMTVADVDGVIIAGILFDAGPNNSPVLLEVGPEGSTQSHASNPITLSDLFFRVGGAGVGKADVCIKINSNDVIGDHFWVWRADHGDGVGWTINTTKNGIIVNGNNVIIYGLFVEHFHEYQTLWNGENGRVYFYQSEIPYDVPNQESWMDGSENGYASYRVADSVNSHQAWGLGVYSYFRDADVKCNSAIKVPAKPGVRIYHACSVYLAGYGEITHVVNHTGDTAKAGYMRQTIDEYCNNVEQPDIMPKSAVYGTPQTVTISTVTPGATIRYTTDGSEPTPTTGMIYTGPFSVSSTTTIKAIAYKEGMNNSRIATTTIKIDPAYANDIALNKPATASSGNASLAFDGDTTTRWESAWSDPQWIMVDLEAVYSITGVKLVWETAAARDYKIQVSLDKVTWMDAFVRTNGTGGTENITFNSPVQGRYVRMYGIARTTNYGYSLWEFEVYGN